MDSVVLTDPVSALNGDQLYVTGRDESVIEVFDYGRDELPRNGRVLLGGCNPDGATVDEDGYLWSAQWDDACIIRVAPDGTIDRRIEFAGQVVSSLTFGGPDLDLIYVTTTGVTRCTALLPTAASTGQGTGSQWCGVSWARRTVFRRLS